ncbi:MAG TPA: hotdog fold thioesterase [Gemmatimonadaceae bacterium]|nr:hotdog fold thioesterase [Gemmatimonadaceae bacterium]
MSELDAETAQNLAERVVDAMMAADAFSRWLGIRVLAVRPREATVAMMVRDEMVNGFGVSHGAIVYALADSALAFASNTHGRITVSIENSITYPHAVHVGDELVANALEEGASNRLGYYRVTVTRKDGTVVGLFRGTVYKTKRDFFSRSVAASEE